MVYKPGDMEPETIRVALVGALRYGKPLVIDNMDMPLEWGKFATYFNAIVPGLWDMVWDGSIVHGGSFMKVLRAATLCGCILYTCICGYVCLDTFCVHAQMHACIYTYVHAKYQHVCIYTNTRRRV